MYPYSFVPDRVIQSFVKYFAILRPDKKIYPISDCESDKIWNGWIDYFVSLGHKKLILDIDIDETNVYEGHSVQPRASILKKLFAN